MRILKIKEVKPLAQEHTVGKCQRLDLNPGLSGSKTLVYFVQLFTQTKHGHPRVSALEDLS